MGQGGALSLWGSALVSLEFTGMFLLHRQQKHNHYKLFSLMGQLPPRHPHDLKILKILPLGLMVIKGRYKKFKVYLEQVKGVLNVSRVF